MIVIGLMSGSSLDGLDIAICDFSDSDNQLQWDLLESHTVPFPTKLSDKLSIATNLNPKELAQLDSEFAAFCAKHIKHLQESMDTRIDYVASHGHTVYHGPEDGYSLQIGNGGIIAAQSGIPCIADFRMNDIALGGQGAPIVPIVEQVLFPEVQYFLNLGGIVNISIHDEQVTAYDICPCNQILNRLAQKLDMEYDHDGVLASTGTVNGALLNSWSSMSYFDQLPPKSLDNSWVISDFYGVLDQYNIETQDALASMVEFIAIQISQALQKSRIHNKSTNDEIMVTGGGAMNKFMMQRIQLLLPEHMSIKSVESNLINAKEALLMALMGFLRVNQTVNTIPSATGAIRGTCAGAIYLP